MIGLEHFAILAALLFCIGLVGVLTRRHAIIVLIGIEIMLNAANLNFIAFWRYGENSEALSGPLFALFAIAVAAAEVLRPRPAGPGRARPRRPPRRRRPSSACSSLPRSSTSPRIIASPTPPPWPGASWSTCTNGMQRLPCSSSKRRELAILPAYP